MVLLEYLYYRFYKWQQKVGNSDAATVMAIVALSLLVIVYFYGILMLLSVLGLRNVPIVGSALGAGGISLSIILGLYWLLVQNGKYQFIISKYSVETKFQRRQGWVILIATILIGVILLFGSMYIKWLQNVGRL